NPYEQHQFSLKSSAIQAKLRRWPFRVTAARLVARPRPRTRSRSGVSSEHANAQTIGGSVIVYLVVACGSTVSRSHLMGDDASSDGPGGGGERGAAPADHGDRELRQPAPRAVRSDRRVGLRLP